MSKPTLNIKKVKRVLLVRRFLPPIEVTNIILMNIIARLEQLLGRLFLKAIIKLRKHLWVQGGG